MSQYIDWGAWGYVQKGASNWNDDALADAGTETSDRIDLDQTVGMELGVTLVEDAAAALSGDVTISILRSVGVDGGATELFEDPSNDTPLAFTVTPETSATRRRSFAVSTENMGSCKIAATNNAGNSVKVTVEYRTSTIGESA